MGVYYEKIALVLALLMCLPFALFGCGKHSSPESCAKAYIKATYDFDYETIMDLTPRFDEGLMKSSMTITPNAITTISTRMPNATKRTTPKTAKNTSTISKITM